MTTTPSAGRRRLIRIEGDGKAVYRSAQKYNATAEITVGPDGEQRPSVLQHPSLQLSVMADGGWLLRLNRGGSADPEILVSGHIDDTATPTEDTR